MFDGDDEPPDPGSRFAEPEREVGPTVEDPADGMNPADRLPDPEEVDPEIRRSFWTAVLYTKLAVLPAAFGLLLLGFGGDWRLAGACLAVALLGAVRLYQTYRVFHRDHVDD